MTPLAVLPALTGPELDELHAAVEARSFSLQRIYDTARSPEVLGEIGERRAVCGSLLTAIAEARYQIERRAAADPE